MKVKQRGIIKIFPGKMAEAMELEKKLEAMRNRLGAAPLKRYRCLSGRDDYTHTYIWESEWDSFTAMGNFFDKMFESEELKELGPKLDTVMELHEMEFLTEMR